MILEAQFSDAAGEYRARASY